MLTGAARTEAVNYQYFDEFLVNQMRLWLQQDVDPIDVMTKLHLDKLSGEALLTHPNYGYYKSYVKNQLTSYAMDLLSPEEVVARLGMANLLGKTFDDHPNFKFFVKYMEKMPKYREEGWLKHGLTTFDVWQMMEVSRVHPTLLRSSGAFKAYKSYVNLVDKHILKLMDAGFPVPKKLISNTASVANERELGIKTIIWSSAKRPEEFVKFCLGLDKLDEAALKEAPNYKFLEK